MEFWTDGGRTHPVTCGRMPPNMKCEVISSGKVPSWHSSEHTQKGNKWYKEPIYSYDDYKINGRAYAKAAAYEIDDTDSSAVSIASVAPQGAYYSHVFPLSELKGTCNTYGLLGRLESACWNKAYKPKPKEVELGVKLTMDDYYTCPKQSDDILPLVCYVRDSLQELLYKHGIEGKIKVAPVECKVRAHRDSRRAGRRLQRWTREQRPSGQRRASMSSRHQPCSCCWVCRAALSTQISRHLPTEPRPPCCLPATLPVSPSACLPLPPPPACSPTCL